MKVFPVSVYSLTFQTTPATAIPTTITPKTVNISCLPLASLNFCFFADPQPSRIRPHPRPCRLAGGTLILRPRRPPPSWSPAAPTIMSIGITAKTSRTWRPVTLEDLDNLCLWFLLFLLPPLDLIHSTYHISHRPARSRSRSSRSLSRSVSRPSSRSTFFSRPRITSCAASCWARSTPRFRVFQRVGLLVVLLSG